MLQLKQKSKYYYFVKKVSNRYFLYKLKNIKLQTEFGDGK